MKSIIKQNWFWILALALLSIIFIKRNIDVPVQVVAYTDGQLEFGTEDVVLEQTWQTIAKKIKGISFPYFSQSDFTSDVKLSVYSDDYSQLLVEDTENNVVFNSGLGGEIYFDFHRIPVILGERYHIQFTLINASGSGTLLIPSGSNYGGCTVGEKNTNQGAAITITASKYSKLFWVMAVLFPLIAFSLFFMTFFRKKWEDTVALSVFSEGILLYFFGWIEQLTMGINVVYGLALFSLLVAIYIYNRKKESLKDLLSPGVWIYFFSFFVILLVNKESWPAMRDELRHWEIVPRDMFFYDSFANHVGTTVLLPRYLPFAAIIEYVFEYMNGMFSEGILLISYQIMMLSMSIVFCKLFVKKGGLGVVFAFIAMICVPILFFPNILGSIMVDPLIALAFAYILICYFTSENNWFNKIRITSAMVALVLIKEVGLIYAGMATFLILCDILYTQWRDKKFQPSKILLPVIGGIMAIVAFISWQIYLTRPISDPFKGEFRDQVKIDEDSRVNELDSEADNVLQEADTWFPGAIQASGMSLEEIWNVLQGQGDPYQYEVTRLFWTELFDGDTYPTVMGELSFMDLLTAFSVLIMLMTYFGFWREEKERIYGIAVFLFLTSFLLCAFMQLTYWFTFPKYEALDLTSFSRYFAPYLCAVIMFIFYMIYQEFEKIPIGNKRARGLVVVLTFLLITSMPIENVVRRSMVKEGNATKEVIYGHDDIAGILRSVAKRGERVYFVCSESGGLSEYIFRNAACPMVVQHGMWNIVSSIEEVKNVQLEYGENGNGAAVMSVEHWKEILKDYQYVVVFHADKFFQRSYQEMFAKKSTIGDGCVYQVMQKEGNVYLELIGQTGIKSWY